MMRIGAGPAAKTERDFLRALLSKQMLPLSLLLGFTWVIATKAQDLDFPSIQQAIHDIAPTRWASAILFTMLSFWSVGRMETVVHRLLGTDLPGRTVQAAGIASVATAQLTGFGLLTGTLARWRALPDISLWKAAQITGAVSLSFMLALGVLTAFMTLVAGPDMMFSRLLALLGLFGFGGLLAISLWRPRALMRVKLPPVRAQFSLLWLTLLDTAAAGLTLYVLLPEAYVPPFAAFYAAFLLALGAGLLGATPGGVGPFEMMFVLCLPAVPEAPMLAAIMGYRLVYFACPGILAAVVLIAGPTLARGLPRRRKPTIRHQRASLRPAETQPGQPVAIGALSYNSRRAEAGLMRQGEFDLLYDAQDRPLSMVAPTGQSLIMLADPLNQAHCPAETLRALECAAKQTFLTPCVYKCSARTAAVARRAGWRVLRVAQEAKMTPASFDINAPSFRQLRRQLRKAEKSGVTVTEADARPPLAQMQQIAQDWAARRGVARGFSMGRFDADYVSAQRVYLAYHQDKLIGFLTFHEAWREHTLDLMCSVEDAPAGTMHLLVQHAISSAAAQGCASLSLAAVPALSDVLPLPAMLANKANQMTGAAGLIRFKSSFAPRWEPLYLAAPDAIGLALSGIDLVDRIMRPRLNLSPDS